MRPRDFVLAELKQAVTEERKSQIRVLHLLLEIETDRHYLTMGYPSLFEFTTQELQYSAGAAMRRIQSMRLLKVFPAVETKIERGALSLCTVAHTQSFFRNEDLKRKEQGLPKMDLDEKAEILESIEHLSLRETEKKLAQISPEAALPKEKIRAVSADKTMIQFLASEELMKKLDKLKGLLAPQNERGSYEGLFELLAELALKKLDPEEKEIKTRTGKAPVRSPSLQGSPQSNPPTRRTSSSISTPNSARARLFASSISAPTSAAVAPPRLTIKLGCFSENCAPPI